MARIFILFLCLNFSGIFGEIFFISNLMSWTQAQNYCREYYTDLSFVNSQSDQDALEAVHNDFLRGWFGLYRDPNNSSQWLWSGGGSVTYQNWEEGQPDNYENIESKGEVCANGQWNDVYEMTPLPFFCVQLSVVKTKMAWENALDYCRQKNSKLAVFSSETEFLLAKMEIPLNRADRIWINQRFLGDSWMSADGGSTEIFQPWSSGGSLEQCPVKGRCAALNQDGVLESWDCQDKLYFMCKG